MGTRADADGKIAAAHLENFKFSPMQGLNPETPAQPPAEKEHRLLLQDTFAKVRADERARIAAALQGFVTRDQVLVKALEVAGNVDEKLRGIAALTIAEAADLVARNVQ